MKLMRSILTAQLAAAVLFAAAFSASGETIRYQARPGSKVMLEGTSTIHDWEVESGIVGGFMEFDSNFPLDPSKPSEELEVTPKVQVMIPVRSLKSGTKLMDEVMHDAMNVKQHSSIKYKLTEMRAKPRKAGDPLRFDTKGELTVSGVTKPIEMVVTMEPMGDGKIKTVGSKVLKMTDFGIKPPAPAIGLGFIKTADEVTVTFEWITARKENEATASAN